MTTNREKDYADPNERGNGPKNRMEGGDATDDITINNPDSLLRAKPKNKPEKKSELEPLKYKKPVPKK